MIFNYCKKRYIECTTIQQQFEDEWNKVSAVVESESRKQLQIQGYLDYNILNSVLREERDSWFGTNSVRSKWMIDICGDNEIDHERIVGKFRQIHLINIFKADRRHVSTIGLKIFFMIMSFVIGVFTWYGELYFLNSIPNLVYKDLLQMIMFPMLTSVLVYSLCIPYIALSKMKQKEKLIMAIRKEMKMIGEDIVSCLKLKYI